MQPQWTIVFLYAFVFSVKFNSRKENKPTKMTLSQVQEFYKNQTVFITGSTGLLGKLVLRKLLTTCDPKKIYLLIRQHKGKSVAERLETLLDSAVTLK